MSTLYSVISGDLASTLCREMWGMRWARTESFNEMRLCARVLASSRALCLELQAHVPRAVHWFAEADVIKGKTFGVQITSNGHAFTQFYVQWPPRPGHYDGAFSIVTWADGPTYNDFGGAYVARQGPILMSLARGYNGMMLCRADGAHIDCSDIVIAAARGGYTVTCHDVDRVAYDTWLLAHVCGPKMGVASGLCHNAFRRFGYDCLVKL